MDSTEILPARVTDRDTSLPFPDIRFPEYGPPFSRAVVVMTGKVVQDLLLRRYLSWINNSYYRRWINGDNGCCEQSCSYLCGRNEWYQYMRWILKIDSLLGSQKSDSIV